MQKLWCGDFGGEQLEESVKEAERLPLGSRKKTKLDDLGTMGGESIHGEGSMVNGDTCNTEIY